MIATTVRRPMAVSDLAPPRPPRKDREEEPDRPERDSDDDEAPEIPPTEPAPVPVEEPPDAPGQRGPYVVESDRAPEP